MHAADVSGNLLSNDLEPASLYEGDCGPAVVQLQHHLAHLNHYRGPITGQFDTDTKQALEAFQREYELSEVGFFGPQTWYALTFWSQETELPFSSAHLIFAHLVKWLLIPFRQIVKRRNV